MGVSKIIKIFLAVVLSIGLLSYVGVSQLLQALLNIDLLYLLYLAGLAFMLIWVSCLKWQLFVNASGHECSIWRLMSYYTMSYFFNMFMPSTIGGDVARSYQLGKHLNCYKSAFACTFIERLTGFLAMSLVGAIFVLSGVQLAKGIELAAVVVALISVSISVVLYNRRLFNIIFSIGLYVTRMCRLMRLAARLEGLCPKIFQAIDFARQRPWLLVKALVYSFAFHGLAAVNVYVVARAIGWHDVSLVDLCVVVPLVLLVSIVPLTPSGIGVQEGAFLYFLTRIGATQAQGLGIGLILRAKNTVIALVGGIIWMFMRRNCGEICSDED